MSEATGTLEQTSEVEVTSEEVRWRMEKVVQHACATGMDLEASANDFNRALEALCSQGPQEK